MSLECGVLPRPDPGSDDERLLGDDEPPAVEVAGAGARSPFVVICDHASARIPRKLAKLGLPDSELERHIAWDIGAAGLARKLAKLLDAWLVLQNYSRLVIDCNRRLERPDSITVNSEDTPIPGNLTRAPGDAARRAREIFEPYHARIRSELDERAAAGRASILLFVHTFTPVFRGVTRSLHAGVLYHRDTRLALPLLTALRRESALEIGDNQPYAATALTDYGIIVHAEERGLPPIELEVRQDLVSDDEGQSAWAERLARLIRTAARELGF
jgi:predicted N-formylglutamate amidohydrolase